MIMSSHLTTNITEREIYQRLQVNSEELEQFCQSNLIAELAVFGSILRDDFSSNSDVDVLITYPALFMKKKQNTKNKKLASKAIFY